MALIDQWKEKIIKGSQFNSGIYDESQSIFELEKLGLPFAMACFNIGDNEVIAIGMDKGSQSPRDFIRDNQDSEFILDASKPSRRINTMFGAKTVHYAKRISKKSNESSFTTGLTIDFREQFRNNWNDLQQHINKLGNPDYHLSGFLQSQDSNLINLGSVISIDGSVNLSNSDIRDLGKLEKIRKEFLITNTKLKSLGKLKEVGYYLDAQDSELETLGDLQLVDGYLDLQNTRVKSLGKLKKVNGYLDLKGTPIEDLAELEIVDGHLNLDGTPIKSLGKLKKVTGSVFLKNTPIKSLGNLTEVGGDIVLGHEVSDLGNLKLVGNNLFMEGTNVSSLGQLENIGGWLLISNTPLAKVAKESDIRQKVRVGSGIIFSKKYKIQNLNSSQLGVLSIAYGRNIFPRPNKSDILWESLGNGHCKLYFEINYFAHLSDRIKNLVSSNAFSGSNAERDWLDLSQRILASQQVDQVNESSLQEYELYF